MQGLRTTMMDAMAQAETNTEDFSSNPSNLSLIHI